MKKILLTGASGFLGGNFCHYYAAHYEIHAVYHSHNTIPENVNGCQADLCKAEEVKKLIEAIKPDAIIHLAALSDPNKCQQQPDLSEKINIEASENLAALAAELRVPFIFSSTDLVFDGKKAPYKESDIPAPVNTYGMHKSIAEQAVLDIYPDATICRLPLMYGHSFTQGVSFLQPMLQKLSAGETMNLFTDEYRSMASAREVCRGLMVCLEGPGEIFHLGGKEKMSRYQFAAALCRVFDYDKSLLIKAKQKDVPMPAPRPKDVSLSSEKALNKGWMQGDLAEELTHIKSIRA